MMIREKKSSSIALRFSAVLLAAVVGAVIAPATSASADTVAATPAAVAVSAAPADTADDAAAAEKSAAKKVSAKKAAAEKAAVPPFSDVPASSPFYADVNWFATAGISAGYADGTFRPLATVDRQTMAAFLYRLIHPGQALPTCTTAAFKDVPVSNQFCGAIKWASDEEIALGYADGNFRPSAAVNREIAALFLARAAHATPLFCTSAPFTDVPSNYPYCSTIKWAVDKNIAKGWSDGTFRPKTLVTRQAMAAFFHRYVESL